MKKIVMSLRNVSRSERSLQRLFDDGVNAAYSHFLQYGSQRGAIDGTRVLTHFLPLLEQVMYRQVDGEFPDYPNKNRSYYFKTELAKLYDVVLMGQQYRSNFGLPDALWARLKNPLRFADKLKKRESDVLNAILIQHFSDLDGAQLSAAIQQLFESMLDLIDQEAQLPLLRNPVTRDRVAMVFHFIFSHAFVKKRFLVKRVHWAWVKHLLLFYADRVRSLCLMMDLFKQQFIRLTVYRELANYVQKVIEKPALLERQVSLGALKSQKRLQHRAIKGRGLAMAEAAGEPCQPEEGGLVLSKLEPVENGAAAIGEAKKASPKSVAQIDMLGAQEEDEVIYDNVLTQLSLSMSLSSIDSSSAGRCDASMAGMLSNSGGLSFDSFEASGMSMNAGSEYSGPVDLGMRLSSLSGAQAPSGCAGSRAGWEGAGEACGLVAPNFHHALASEQGASRSMSRVSGHSCSVFGGPMSAGGRASLSVPPGFTEEDRYRYRPLFQNDAVVDGVRGEGILEGEIECDFQDELFNDAAWTRFIDKYNFFEKKGDAVTTVTP